MYQNYIFDLYGTLVDIHTNEKKAYLWKKMSLFFGKNVEDIVKGGPHRSLVEEQVVKNHGRCKYQKGSNAGPDIFSVTIQFHKNVNPLSNFINLYYTHAIPKIQPQPHLREKKETAILEKQI